MKHDASSNKFIATNALRSSLRRRVKMTNTTIKAGNREEKQNVACGSDSEPNAPTE
jgi:hypothetical protein